MSQQAAERRLVLSDRMILVAAAGVGIAVFQAICVSILGGYYHFQGLLTRPAQGWTGGQVVVRVVQWLGPTIPLGAAWTGVLPLLRLRRPRPALRQVIGQPGMVACLAAVAGLVWATLGLLQAVAACRVTATPSTNDGLGFVFVVEQIFPDMGLAVAASWLALGLAGVWRSVADWPDRLGRILGCYWIGLGLLWTGRRYLAELTW